MYFKSNPKKIKYFTLSTIKLLVLFFFTFNTSFSQTDTENQFSNEFQTNSNLGKKVAIENDFGQVFTSGTVESNPFYKNSQLYLRSWLHYYASEKWKLSGFVAYFFNKDVPEISQNRLPEIRFAAQGIYYFSKGGDYTLSNRIRVENRIFIEDTIEVVYRFRDAVKFVFPISKIKSGNGYTYGIVADEVFFKTNGNATGRQFFDRNRFTLGLGYNLSDTVQFEVGYQNEYLPRPSGDQMFHVISTTIIFNDLISSIKKQTGIFQKH